MQQAKNDEQIEFVDDRAADVGPAHAADADPGWMLLVIDDDEEVHRATAFALQNATILGRPLRLVHAYSAAEARGVLETQGERIAVVLLDVVMETAEAGLDLVPVIRRELGLTELRIILRTGQPGYAPELGVVRDYDINDYRTKSELTHVRLITALTSAIRSYEQIRTISASRRGLDLIVQSASELFGRRALASFAEGVLTQIAALLRLEPDGLLCAQNGSPFSARHDQALHILGAAGRFREHVSRPLSELAEREIVESISRCMAARTSIYEPRATVLFFSAQSGRAAVVYVATDRTLDAVDRRLLEVFAVNIGVGFDNVGLFERLNFQAYFDPLTRLPNRVRFVEEVDADLASGTAVDDCCVALIDLARFSEVNNALGQRSGDAVVLAVARRLRASFPDTVRLARMVGDSFALFGARRALAPAVLERLFEAPFHARGHAIPLQIRVGVAPVVRGSPERPPRATDLLRDAAVALSHAKRSPGAGACIYTEAMAAQTHKRVAMLNELRAALDFHRGLLLHYQPQVDPQIRVVRGVEALIRWRKDCGEMVPPDDFIPLAEYTGLIIEIGAWVFRTACEQLVAWRASGLNDLCMAVNVSALQFRHDGFVDMIRRTLDATGAPAHKIELEITESVAMEDVQKVAAQLQSLKELGLRISLDDFGCGYSSLSSLSSLPIDRLKVDRSFVRQLTPANAREGIVQTILRLAEGSAMGVIAEGVETPLQADLLRDLGCREMQGFLYGRPMAAEAFPQWEQAFRTKA